MWKPIPKGDWPFWALDVTSLWKHKSGHWLTSTVNSHSSLWELRDAEGRVLTNQLDLPFSEHLAGAPVAWADAELAARRDRSRAEA